MVLVDGQEISEPFTVLPITAVSQRDDPADRIRSPQERFPTARQVFEAHAVSQLPRPERIKVRAIVSVGRATGFEDDMVDVLSLELQDQALQGESTPSFTPDRPIGHADDPERSERMTAQHFDDLAPVPGVALSPVQLAR